jgi:hypothetical protein
MSGLPEQSTIALLAESQAILAELRSRGVIRSGNAPAGDYAEWLVRLVTGGTLAGNSERGWDVKCPDGTTLQVKARVLTAANPSRQLSSLRSWDFTACIVILFNGGFQVQRATRLPTDTLRSAARWQKHVSGWRVMATDALLDKGEDWTEAIRAAQARSPVDLMPQSSEAGQ